MFIEVQLLLTFCIDMIIGYEFTYPRNCDLNFFYEN